MKRIYLLTGAVFLFLGTAFGGPVSIAFNPGTLTGNAGDELTYSGTISADPDVFLNGICFMFTSTACDIDNSDGLGFFTIDTNTFYGSVPGTLTDGIYIGDILGIAIDPSAPTGVYSGTVTLLGGGDEFGSDALASGAFQLVVAPEPSTALLLLGAGLSIGVLRRRRA